MLEKPDFENEIVKVHRKEKHKLSHQKKKDLSHLHLTPQKMDTTSTDRDKNEIFRLNS